MKYIFIALAAISLLACSAEQPSKTESTNTVAVEADTRLAAVLIYADWCSSCKVLDPKIQEAKAQGHIDGVQFVQLDYTRRDAEAMFAQADALGVGDAVRAQLSAEVKTGILLLVDIDDKTVVDDLRKELSADDIRARIQSAASAA